MPRGSARRGRDGVDVADSRRLGGRERAPRRHPQGALRHLRRRSDPTVDAIGVLNGRIVALGDDATATSAARTHDLGDAVGFPGFHDAHAHTSGFGRSLGELDLSTPPIRSLDDALRGRRPAARRHRPRAPSSSGAATTRTSSAAPTPRVPRSTRSPGAGRCGCSTPRGTCASSTPRRSRWSDADLDADVDGGRVVRDADGEPTGLLEERAQALARRLAVPRSVASIASAIDRAHRRLRPRGSDERLRRGRRGRLDRGERGGARRLPARAGRRAPPRAHDRDGRRGRPAPDAPPRRRPRDEGRRRRDPHRARRRLASHRGHEGLLGRLADRTDVLADPRLRGRPVEPRVSPARPRRAARPDRRGAPRRLAGRDPRHRRRRRSLRARRLRGRPRPATSSRPPAPHRALRRDDARGAGPHRAARRHPRATGALHRRARRRHARRAGGARVQRTPTGSRASCAPASSSRAARIAPWSTAGRSSGSPTWCRGAPSRAVPSRRRRR